MQSNDSPDFTRFSDALLAQMHLQRQYDELENDFLKKNYPPLCQKIQYYVERYLDGEDYENSGIYDLYPSQATIENIADRIYLECKDDSPHSRLHSKNQRNTSYTMRTETYTLIYPILLGELYRRRMRKYLNTLYN